MDVPGNSPQRLTAEHVSQLSAVLAESLAAQSRMQFVLLATMDGRVIAHHTRIKLDPARMAALASTMMSMSGAAARELGGEHPDECLLTYHTGMLCLGRTGAHGRWVLCKAASSELTMGLLVSGWRRTAAALQALSP